MAKFKALVMGTQLSCCLSQQQGDSSMGMLILQFYSQFSYYHGYRFTFFIVADSQCDCWCSTGADTVDHYKKY